MDLTTPLHLHTIASLLVVVIHYGLWKFYGQDEMVSQAWAVLVGASLNLILLFYFHSDLIFSGVEYFAKGGLSCPEGTHQMPPDIYGEYTNLGSNSETDWCMPNDAEHI